MPIEEWSDTVSVIRLGDDPQFTDDLAPVDATTPGRGHAIVLDFSSVHFINSSNLSRLLVLRSQRNAAEGRLVLCGISTALWGTFLVTGLDKVFDFSESVPTALATLQMG